MLSAHKQWSTAFTVDFINLYRSFPCLWKMKSKEYPNKSKRDDAYQKLVDLCKTVYADANTDYVKARINSLRGSFRKEFKKVSASKKSGVSADNVYKPKLWYYDLLEFTGDQEIATPATLNIKMEETQFEYIELNNDYNDSELPAEEPPQEYIIEPITPTMKRTGEKKSDIAAKKHMLLDKAEELIDGDEYSSFGVLIATKLRKMDEKQRLYCEKVINQALFKGLLNELTAHSDIRSNGNEEKIGVKSAVQTHSFGKQYSNKYKLIHCSASSTVGDLLKE